MSDSKAQSQSQSVLTTPPPTSWLLKFMAQLAEGRAMFWLFVVPPVLFALWVVALRGTVSFVSLLVLMALSAGWAYINARGRNCTYRTDLTGKTAIVTGGNTGIGAENVRLLAEMDARVVLACRDAAKGESARTAIVARLPAGCKGSVEVRVLDLSCKASIKAFADAWGSADLHILVNNAGVMMCPYSTTTDGFEMQIGTNHLGHMYLTLLLLPVIKRCAARVVNVSSAGHAVVLDVPPLNWAQVFAHSERIGSGAGQKPYRPDGEYGNSKLANVLFTRALEQRLSGSGAHAYCCHPGFVRTDLARHQLGIKKAMKALGDAVTKNSVEGAQTQLYLAIHPDAKPVVFHSDCQVVESSPISYSDESAEQLWAESCKQLQINA